MSAVRRAMAGVLVRAMGRHEDAGAFGLRLRSWMMHHVPGQITCTEFERFVYDYHEGLLGARERRVFDLHMDLCPMCRVHFASYLRAIELGRRLCASEEGSAPPGLPEDLASAILAARRAR